MMGTGVYGTYAPEFLYLVYMYIWWQSNVLLCETYTHVCRDTDHLMCSVGSGCRG